MAPKKRCSRVRDVIGSGVPLAASLDLHANVTERMVELADVFTIFRTYPHLDMALTGARAYHLLNRFMKTGRVCKSFRKLPFLIPLPAQCTSFEPCESIYSRLDVPAHGDVWSLDFATGFPPADIYDCGPGLVGYGGNQGDVDRSIRDLYEFVMGQEPTFENGLLAPDQAVNEAMASAGRGPVVLADVQDNPGAGGSSDTVGLLSALVRNRAQGSVVAILNDPEVAGLAVSQGVGARLDTGLGGKSGQPGQSPYQSGFVVERLGAGDFTCTGTMYGGLKADIGPLALLRVDRADCDVRVIVSSKRMQCLDLSVFRHMGIEPERQHILAIKTITLMINNCF